MRFATCSLVALLVAHTIAAVPRYERRTDVFSSAEETADVVMVVKDAPNDGKNPGDDTDSNTVDNQDLNFANLTSSHLTKRWGDDYNVVHIRAGGPEQNVGTLRGKRLHDKIYQCLSEILSPHPDDPNMKPPFGDNWCEDELEVLGTCMHDCNIPNIVYVHGPNAEYATDAVLNMRVWWPEINDGAHAGLRHVAYDLIANMYRLMADDPLNCAYANILNSRRTKLCNVAKHVLVVFPANDDRPVQVRFNVKLEVRWGSNGKMKGGRYPCQSSLPAIADHFKTKAKQEIAKVMSWDASKMPLFMSCQKESCFDTRDGYNLGKGWREPKECDPLGSEW